MVGECDETRACLLYESDEDMILIVSSVTDPCVATMAAPRTFRVEDPGTHHPQTIVLQNLLSNTNYTASWVKTPTSPTAPSSYVHSFTTSSGVASPARLLFVSCNFLDNRGNTDLWQHACDVDVSSCDVAVHMGDQIYGDRIYWDAMKLLNRRFEKCTAQERARFEDVIVNMYADEYCKTWMHPPTRHFLANTSNLMIWDDHDSGVDGSRIDPSNAKGVFIRNAAKRAFHMYQSSLRLDNATNTTTPGRKLPHQGYRKRYGNMELMMIDNISVPESHLDGPTIFALRNALSTTECTDVVLVFPVPPVPIHRTGVKARLLNAVFPLSEDYDDNRVAVVYGLARDFLKRGPSHRIAIVGGDYHMGANAIVSGGPRNFPLFVSSGITNFCTVLEKIKLELMMKASKAITHDGFEITYDASQSMARRNYAVFDTRAWQARLVFAPKERITWKTCKRYIYCALMFKGLLGKAPKLPRSSSQLPRPSPQHEECTSV